MSSRFEADWLSLREPADRRARSARLVEGFRAWSRGRDPLHVVDLGAGTGANLRFLAPQLPVRQYWTLIDHDPALLARVHIPDRGPTVRSVCADLRQWRGVLGESRLPDLVTAAALLDLVGASWLDDLVQSCREMGAAALFALSYDGRLWGAPPDPDDRAVRRAVNAHQQRDKGLGPALGPRAAACAAAGFRAAGFRVLIARSPWHLGSESEELATTLIRGWLAAACEQVPADRERYRAWAQRRERDIRSGRVRFCVGHLDLLALPSVAP
ncbi:glycosyl transferase, group 1 [Thioalkalivibrio nitratireducens DSM 14787]|uniref:Glycosyl transferase, group 1 n=1 Tax=Thioalkalivibrio nitratireducens (strain DSM 14787 / UNIQEM 213 / ALEN2) TaxID=1255043 RepID=L0DWP1_THIND|nr:class I SAM-dependent methyltransferase [Thioalkalivibrio nitratireducens]AGA33458.1 glycosyl transferase, group 1 [Thioalkalivibrio nitratireducens DSM 14787]